MTTEAATPSGGEEKSSDTLPKESTEGAKSKKDGDDPSDLIRRSRVQSSSANREITKPIINPIAAVNRKTRNKKKGTRKVEAQSVCVNIRTLRGLRKNRRATQEEKQEEDDDDDDNEDDAKKELRKEELEKLFDNQDPPEMTYAAPESFICPLSHEIMQEPVMTYAGSTYERKIIEEWLNNNETDPLTNEDLSGQKKQLFPNRALRDSIEKWRFEYDEKHYHDNKEGDAYEVDTTHKLHAHSHNPPRDHENSEMELDVNIASEEDEGDTSMFKNPPRFFIYGVLGIFCIIAGVVLAAVVSTGQGKGREVILTTQEPTTSAMPSLNPTHTPYPTQAPSTYRGSLRIKQQIEQQIARVFGRDYLKDKTSSQYKAVDWLIYDDPYQIEPHADNLIQRFIMAFFYLETSQEGEWKSCNQPTGTQQDSCYFYLLTSTMTEPWKYREMYWQRWLGGTHECFWAGVTCRSDKVTEISLDGYNLTGSFPTELTKLDYLRGISLTHNYLTGTLPEELVEMWYLTDIELQHNRFTGTLPLKWFDATNLIDVWYDGENLIHINLASNKFIGRIPPDFGKLTELQRLFLQNNQLTGALPSEIYDMTSLKSMFVGNNQITGTLSTEVGELTNLEYLFIEGNPLTGTLPSELGKLTELRELNVHDTSMTGTVPEEIFTELWEQINNLDLTSSEFSGTLSTNIGLLGNISRFLVGENNFSGTIPTEAAEMSKLRQFQVQGNQLTGTMPLGICTLRGDTGLYELFADCSTTSSGETPIDCPSGCCTLCCNQDTGICLDASS